MGPGTKEFENHFTNCLNIKVTVSGTWLHYLVMAPGCMSGLPATPLSSYKSSHELIIGEHYPVFGGESDSSGGMKSNKISIIHIDKKNNSCRAIVFHEEVNGQRRDGLTDCKRFTDWR